TLEQRDHHGCVRAFESDLGETVFGDLHGGARLLHLLAQGLHLDDREAGIVSDDNGVGVLEDTVHFRDELFLSRSIHCKLFPVWRPVFRVAAPPVATSRPPSWPFGTKAVRRSF